MLGLVGRTASSRHDKETVRLRHWHGLSSLIRGILPGGSTVNNCDKDNRLASAESMVFELVQS
jgi:hypothetical protein